MSWSAEAEEMAAEDVTEEAAEVADAMITITVTARAAAAA